MVLFFIVKIKRKGEAMKKEIISLCLVMIIIVSLCAEIVSLKLNTTSVNADDTETVTTSVLKVWDDYDNYDNIRPKEINADLWRWDNVDTIKTVTLSEENGWYYADEETYPKYVSESEGGYEIPYSWDTSKSTTGNNFGKIEGYEHYVDVLDNITIITDCHEISETKKDTVTLQKLDEKGDFLDQCKLRLVNASEELITWTSNDNTSINILDTSLEASMNEDGSLVVKGLTDGEYTYEEIQPKAGYTKALRKQFKIQTEEHAYTYHWYTSIEKAVEDANSLTTENADCYRNHKDVEAGVFILNNKAYVILLKNVADISTLAFDRDTVFDLEDHTLTFAEGSGLQYCSDLKLLDGTIKFTNISRGINGLVSATYQSSGTLEMNHVTVNHASNIGGTRTINTYASDTKIENCTFIMNYSAGGYGLMFPNPDGKAVLKNNQITSKNSGKAAMYSLNSGLKTLEMDGNTMETVSGQTSYGVYASGSTLTLKSGEFRTTSSGGNAISIYAGNGSNVSVDYVKSYSQSTDTSCWTQGIYIGGAGSKCTINDCYIETMGTKYNNVALYIGAGAEAQVYGGYLYALPVISGSSNDSYGNGIRNQGTCLIEERNGKSITVSGGHSGIQSDYGSTLTVNSGTMESPNHGGAYLCNGAAGHVEIHGGTFRNNYSDYDESVVGNYNGTGIHNYGSLYIGHPEHSGQAAWEIDIRNAEISGDATWGLVLRAADGYVPATVNLYNTYVSGNRADIWVSNYENIHKYNAFVNLYEGTTLGHNIVYDQYGVANNEPHIIDHRQGVEEFETITQ